MASKPDIADPTQALSPDEAPATSTPPPDDTQFAAEPQSHTQSHNTPSPRSADSEPEKVKPRRKSRPDQVDPRPLPPMDEWREVNAAGECMYYGFYAGDDGLQR
ncbi:hypothetical protein GSI_01244 [Ganoderma sinense ZZ0214-1]|uniref:Uncharacterized protein n=1 Tax=Ganoderma sinense ZZ0214-1 TaxID=1077348 RepID=A0A2G8SUW7_9APHY|nr:hypothetical protein GSI_01244 [Ganoderma sinense ZZ0214-1]